MAKLYKLELYIIDYNNNYENLEEIIQDIDNSIDCSINHFNAQEVKIDWNDEIDLNYSDCPVDNFRNYFEGNKNIFKEEKCTYKEELIVNTKDWACELMKNNKCFIGEWDDFYLGDDNYWHFKGEWCCEYFNPEADCCRPNEI